MRSRAFRRHQTETHLWRRLKEDRNQHYEDVNCGCWRGAREMARFKEQPKACANPCCANPRAHLKGAERLTIQERRAFQP